MVEGDHPRVCGEHDAVPELSACDSGSSPRMRGTPTQGQYFEYISGIIPAYAGNTRNVYEMRYVVRDHPRVCGEHQQLQPTASLWAGSSPRMRGTLRQGHRKQGAFGIIPAYAGNTNVGDVQCVVLRDHPRVCGEHRFPMGNYVAGRGSSPRMRGTHLRKLYCYPFCGIIPAYAGNT